MKKLKLLTLGVGIGISSYMLFAAPNVFAATKTWTGGGSDSNVSTGANWGGSAPTAGDDLVFPITVSNKTVTNDLTAGTSFNTITISGTASSGTGYTVSGNSIALVAGITYSVSGSQHNTSTLSLPISFTSAQTISSQNDNSLTLSGVLSGSGNLTLSGGSYIILSGTNTFTGTATVTSKLSLTNAAGLGNASGATTVNSGGQLTYAPTSKTYTVSEPFTFNVGTSSGFGVLRAEADCTGSYCSDSDITFSGAITLGADVEVDTTGKLTFTGALTGAHTLTLNSGSAGYGTLVINSSANGSSTPNGSYGAGVASSTTYSGDNPSQNITLGNSQTGIVDGNYGNVNVLSGGILKGTGTIQGLSVASGGTVAPGHSPGCLTSSGATINGTYQAEIGGTTACTGYDQLKVTGSVDVTGATLSLSLYNGFKPSVGQKYTIIDNDTAADPVTGTFSGLAEGATVTVSGYVFKVSYVGGDGNDVVLTVQTVPNAPSTGLTLIKTHPLLSAVSIMAAAGGMMVIARRGKFAGKRR